MSQPNRPTCQRWQHCSRARLSLAHKFCRTHKIGQKENNDACNNWWNRVFTQWSSWSDRSPFGRHAIWRPFGARRTRPDGQSRDALFVQAWRSASSPATEVNYRANIFFALKMLGATQNVGISAVGSLAEAIAPGDLAIPSQYFYWTRGRRPQTFFGDGVAVQHRPPIPSASSCRSGSHAMPQRSGSSCTPTSRTPV